MRPFTHRVVVVGGGFAGLQTVRALRRAPVDVTLVDRRNFHLFQPLLYQAATGALTAAEIASPLRGVLKRQGNARVVLAEVTGFDLDQRRVLLEHGAPLAYDSLVVATGATHDYLGHDDWRSVAPGLKTLEDAMEIRRRILSAFEAAELETDPDRRLAWLTFVVVGGGPTGVELAGQIAEIANDTLRRDFRSIDPRTARILLVEADERLLGTFPERLSARTGRALERLGVRPMLDHLVVGVQPDAVDVQRHGISRRIPARTVVWAAGVRRPAWPPRSLGPAAATWIAPAGSWPGPDSRSRVSPEVLALGDMVAVHDARPGPRLPGVAPVAMQQGRYAGRAIRMRLKGRDPGAFRYRDKGNVATIGRLKAVADVRGVPLSGTPAWLVWLVVHLFYLVGLQNRALVLIRWTGELRHARTRRPTDHRNRRRSAARDRARAGGVGAMSELTQPAGGAPTVLGEVARRVPGITRRLAAIHGVLMLHTRGRLFGTWFGAPVLVLETRGRRSGTPRRTPLVYLPHGEGFAVVPANAGAARPPAWWLNLQAAGEGYALLGAWRQRVTPSIAGAGEHERLWQRLAAVAPVDHYQRRCPRALPLVILEPAGAPVHARGSAGHAATGLRLELDLALAPCSMRADGMEDPGENAEAEAGLAGPRRSAPPSGCGTAPVGECDSIRARPRPAPMPKHLDRASASPLRKRRETEVQGDGDREEAGGELEPGRHGADATCGSGENSERRGARSPPPGEVGRPVAGAEGHP